MRIHDPLSNWLEPEAITEWGDSISPRPKISWFEYINYYVHPDVVSVVGRLLIPAFIEHEGGVFLRDNFTLSGYSEWKAKLGAIVAVEKVINHQHVYDLFATGDQVSEKSFEGVANLIAHALKLALVSSFPERRFDVTVSNSDQDYGPTVGFYSVEALRQVPCDAGHQDVATKNRCCPEIASASSEANLYVQADDQEV